ncbi:MAG: hypothetical protein ACHQ17_08045 [Polyangia bacterium]|jgi:hypothetical protein
MRRLGLILVVTVTLVAKPARALEREADFRHFSDYAWFVLGALSGFVAHELGHVVTDLAYGKSISFQPTHLGPIPFFAIEPCCNLTHEQEYVVASMGFNVQSLSSELILWLQPHLRSHRRAYLKGILVLDIGLSLGYGITAFAGIGPPQSDVNTMARGLQIPSWPIGLWLVVPAMVDVYRYLVPGSRWAPWLSLQAKMMTVGASLTF